MIVNKVPRIVCNKKPSLYCVMAFVIVNQDLQDDRISWISAVLTSVKNVFSFCGKYEVQN